MHISTENEIDGAAARELRVAAGMTQRVFWPTVRVSQAVGHRYEAGRRIPRPVRTLLFMRYVAGLQFDASTPEGAAELKRLAELQASGATVQAAKEYIAKAARLLASAN